MLQVHMSNDRTMFETFEECSDQMDFGFGTHSRSPITGKGSVVLETEAGLLRLHDVMYVPSATSCFLSTGKLDRNTKVSFHPGQEPGSQGPCVLNLSGGRQITVPHWHGKWRLAYDAAAAAALKTAKQEDAPMPDVSFCKVASGG